MLTFISLKDAKDISQKGYSGFLGGMCVCVEGVRFYWEPQKSCLWLVVILSLSPTG